MTQQELIENQYRFGRRIRSGAGGHHPRRAAARTLDLDSLDLVDVVVLVDKNFGVTLTGPDFKELKTFQDFYDLIISRTNGK